ncbi:MAG: hypothetical protein KDH09_11505 [Chrysiogenetes bacterium]|nr:hypothetical protein [Chrysiogenetes bacterium]
MRIRFIFMALALVLATPILAHAQGRPFNPRTPQAMGMGNVKVGIGGSYNALFYNPAGLGAIEEAGQTTDSDLFGDNLKDAVWELQALSILAETNSDTQSFINDIKDVDETNVQPFLDKHRGDAIYARIDSTSYFTMKKGRFGFGVAGLFDYTVEAAIQDAFTETVSPVAGTDTLRTRKTADIGGVIGASYDVVEEWLTLGASIKAFNRWQTDAVFADIPDGIASTTPAGAGDMPDFNFDGDLVLPFGDGCAASSSPTNAAGTEGGFACDHSSSFTVGGDIGAMAYLPLKEIGLDDSFLRDGRMQLGVVMQDIGRTRLSGASFAAPNANGNDIPMSVDVGIAYMQQFEIGRFKLGADFRDLNRDQVSLADKFSIGAEMEFKEVVTLRAGMNETGLAAGLALRLWAVRLQGGVIQEKPDLPADGRDLRYYASLGLGWYN